MRSWNPLEAAQKPTKEQMAAYVKSPLWNELCSYLEESYQAGAKIEYSRCCSCPGWNVKYKKAGRSLCTLYPKEGYFTSLVVFGEKELLEAELKMPQLTGYLQTLFEQTKTGNGQKWMMIEVREQEVLEDVKQCIAIRRKVRK